MEFLRHGIPQSWPGTAIQRGSVLDGKRNGTTVSKPDGTGLQHHDPMAKTKCRPDVAHTLRNSEQHMRIHVRLESLLVAVLQRSLRSGQTRNSSSKVSHRKPFD